MGPVWYATQTNDRGRSRQKKRAARTRSGWGRVARLSIKCRKRDDYAFLQHGFVQPGLHLAEAVLQHGLVQPGLHLDAVWPATLEHLQQHLLAAHPIGPVSSATMQKTPRKATKKDPTRRFI